MVYVITGAIHSGKTSLVSDVVDVLRDKGVAVCGFLSVAVIEGGRYLGYDGVDVKGGGKFPLLRNTADKGSLKAGGFYFVSEGIKRACGIIEESKTGEVVVIDELGPAEIVGGKGLWRSALGVFSEGRYALVVVREGLLEKFRSLAGQAEVRVYTAGSDSAGKIALDIRAYLT